MTDLASHPTPDPALASPGDLLFTEILADGGARADQPITLRHPFLVGAVESAPLARQLLQAAHHALTVPPRTTHAFATDAASVRLWRAELDGHVIEGVTAALYAGGRREVRVLLRPLPVTSLWREKVRIACAGLVADADWELPAGSADHAPPDAVAEAKLPFELASDMVFHSPVLSQPVVGAALVGQVVANAAAIYGTRTVGAQLAAGADLVSLWTASAAGLPLEAASHVRFDSQRRGVEMTVYMQPFPAVRWFRDRVRARSPELLPASFFELA